MGCTEEMKCLFRGKGKSLWRGKGKGRAVVQHSCAFGCIEEKFPVERAVSNSLRGICVFEGRTGAAAIPEQCKQGENRTGRLAQSKASPTQGRPEEDAKRTGHEPDFSGQSFRAFPIRMPSSRSLCLTATSAPVLCELFQSCFEAIGISGSQNIP